MARILVVEDEEDFRCLITDYLEMLGHEVLAAASASAAGELIGQQPELALVDWTLPDGTGDGVAKELRSKAPGCEVIIMTGHRKEVVAGLGSDVHVLSKPFRLSALAALLSRMQQGAPHDPT